MIMTLLPMQQILQLTRLRASTHEPFYRPLLSCAAYASATFTWTISPTLAFL